VAGHSCLQHPEVKAAISLADNMAAEEIGITRRRVLEELAVLAFSSADHYKLDELGKLTTTDNAPDRAINAIASIKQTTRTNKDESYTTTEYRLWNKVEALKHLGTHLGLFDKKIELEHSGKITVGWEDAKRADD